MPLKLLWISVQMAKTLHRKRINNILHHRFRSHVFYKNCVWALSMFKNISLPKSKSIKFNQYSVNLENETHPRYWGLGALVLFVMYFSSRRFQKTVYEKFDSYLMEFMLSFRFLKNPKRSSAGIEWPSV